MNLVIDIGNTFTKLALFQNAEMIAFSQVLATDFNGINQFCKSNPAITHAIISAVKTYPAETEIYLKLNYSTLFFSHLTPLPIQNSYLSPETLGEDRLAAAVAAHQLFPHQPVLIVDAGTAITFDLVNENGEYMGGGISPGIRTRYKALHEFTSKLPFVDFIDTTPLIGKDTIASIQSGVLNGVIAEVDGIIMQYQGIYPDIQIILTGGDHYYFDKRLKIKTFAAPNLVLEGLNRILNFNLETH